MTWPSKTRAQTSAGTAAPDLMAAFGESVGRHNSNRGRRFPPDPIRVNDVVRLLEACTPQSSGRLGELASMRLRALIVLLYRTGLRISEALALVETDLDLDRRSILVRRGKGGKRRIVLMDDWGWKELGYWLEQRRELPPGALICVVRGRTAGQPMEQSDVRRQLKDAALRAGLRKRIAPHQFRHGFTVESHHEGVPLPALQRQLGHAHLGVTEIYLRGIDDLEALAPVAERQPPRIIIPGPREKTSG